MDSDDDADDADGRVALGLRDLVVPDYNEHAAHHRTYFGTRGDVVSVRPDQAAGLSCRTGSTDASTPAAHVSAAGNTARGEGSGSRMPDRDRLPDGWIEEEVPNYPNKRRWWRSAEHQLSDSKPLRSWPAVCAELVASGVWDALPEQPRGARSTHSLPPREPEPAAPEPEAAPQTLAEKNKAKLVKWRKEIKDAEAVAMRDVGFETYLVEKAQIIKLMTVEVPKQCRCKTKDCAGHFELVKCSTKGHGGSAIMWFRCNGDGCARTVVFHGSSYINLDRTFTSASARFKGAEAVGFMEVVIALLSGELHHAYSKAITRRGGDAYGAQYFNDIISWLYPYVEVVLDRQIAQERARMKVRAFPIT